MCLCGKVYLEGLMFHLGKSYAEFGTILEVVKVAVMRNRHLPLSSSLAVAQRVGSLLAVPFVL